LDAGRQISGAISSLEVDMAHYLLEASASPQTWAALLAKPHDRMETVRPVFERLGGKVEAYYFLVGQNKMIVIAEFPEPIDAVKVEALFLASMSTGAVISYSVTQILTSAEIIEAYQFTPQLGLRVPTSAN
jgi:uncharacterized protein with GYD domain